METPRVRAATFQITLGMFHGYDIMYILRYNGAGVITTIIHGQAKLKACLSELGIPAAEIDAILIVMESQLSYALELGHLDKDTVARLLLRYAAT